MQAVSPARVPQRTLRGGIKIPCLGMGTFGSDHFSAGQVAAAVEGGLACGYRLFDCASVYGNEAQLGEVFGAALGAGTVRREELFVTSKVWNDRHGPGQVLPALKETLRNLRLDYVDAYFVHWPFPNYHAPGCGGDARSPAARPFSAEEFMGVWRQMEQACESGLARCIGMSNMTVKKLEAVLPLCRIPPALIEMELHPCFQQPALFAYCVQRGIQPVGFCPIGSPTRPARDRTADDLADTEQPALVEIARAHGVHPAVVCLKWAVQRGQIPIPFSVREEEYAANLRCVTEDPLTPGEMEVLRGIDRNCRLIKGQVFLWPGAKDWRDLWDGEA